MDSTLVTLKGVIARLTGYAGLTAITGARIYTDIPQQTVFPYALVEIESKPWAQDDGSHMEHIIRTHGFSRKNSPIEAIQITQECYNSLDRQKASIILTSGNILLCDFSGLKDTFKEPDGITWHSVIEFRIIVN